MRFHSEKDKRLALGRLEALAQLRGEKSQRSELRSYDDVIADDSLVITVCYEAHIAMQKMLAAFAELRGDETEGAFG